MANMKIGKTPTEFGGTSGQYDNALDLRDEGVTHPHLERQALHETYTGDPERDATAVPKYGVGGVRIK